MFRASPQVEATQKPAIGADPVTAAPRRDLSPLRRLVPFLTPYRTAIAGAFLSLTVAAGESAGIQARSRLVARVAAAAALAR